MKGLTEGPGKDRLEMVILRESSSLQNAGFVFDLPAALSFQLEHVMPISAHVMPKNLSAPGQDPSCAEQMHSRNDFASIVPKYMFAPISSTPSAPKSHLVLRAQQPGI